MTPVTLTGPASRKWQKKKTFWRRPAPSCKHYTHCPVINQLHNYVRTWNPNALRYNMPFFSDSFRTDLLSFGHPLLKTNRNISLTRKKHQYRVKDALNIFRLDTTLYEYTLIRLFPICCLLDVDSSSLKTAPSKHSDTTRKKNCWTFSPKNKKHQNWQICSNKALFRNME